MKFLFRGLFVAVLVVTPACCTERDAATGVSVTSYRESIAQIRSNVLEIRVDLEAVAYDAEIKKADLQLIDATVSLCTDTLDGKNAGVATTGSGQ
jgi:hypothetical protein